MEIRILGPLEVRRGEEAVSLPRGRARALLALLAIRADTVVSTDRLIDQLWGESPPPTARTKLQGLVSTLRKRLGDGGEVIRTHTPGYALAVDPGAVDAHRFRRMVEQANGSAPSEKSRILRAALDSWRGGALEDFVYEPFAQAEIMVLEGLRQEAVEERIAADLTLGRHRGLVVELQRLLAENPLRERLAGQLMLSLYRSGRQAEALAVYRDTHQRLVEELGVDPGPDLQRLEDQILVQDPSLTLEPTAPDPTETAPVWLPEKRKLVTVAFVGLAAMDAAADPEVSRDAIEGAYRVVEEIIRRHGGRVQGLLGDVVVAVFGLPTAHEDDHRRAVRAAIEIRRTLTGHGPRGSVEFRLGINTGEVVVDDEPGTPSGSTVALAARLQQSARAGEVLLGSRTRRLLGETAVTTPSTSREEAWKLVDTVDAVLRHDLMVGRKRELEELRSAFDRVVERGTPALVEVIGEAGIGKSRLVREFASELEGRAQVLAGHCPSYGEGITFWPLREMVLESAAAWKVRHLEELAEVAGVPGATLAQVLGAAGLVDYPGEPRQLFAAIRDFFVALARQQPIVLVVEDLHWAERTFRELLSRLAHTRKGAILILCLARPEPETRYVEGGDVCRIDLGPLADDQIERLVRSRAGGRRLTIQTLRRVVDRVKGNPLFAEQTAAALGDDEDVEIPLSIQALLAARLDRLGPAERDLARSAAVLGFEFSMPALAALLPEQVHPFLDRHIRVLEDKGILVRSRRRFLNEPALAFSHALTQAAAYRSLTRRDRAELHERAAHWLESTDGTGALDEVIGYHLERAHRDRIDLGLDDHQAHLLGLRAGERLGKAGLEAYAKFDMTASENLLTRAKILLPPDHPLRHRVMRRRAETYPVMGRLDEADAAFAELLEEVGHDQEAGRSLRLERIRIRMIAGPDPMSLDEVCREAADALAAYSAAGNEPGMSQACYLLAFAHVRAGRTSDLERVAWEGLGHARRADFREQVGALWYVSAAMVLGPTPVEKAMTICRKVMADHGHTHGGLLSDLACLHAMRGDFDRARELVARSHEDIVENYRGVRRALTFIAQRGARVEMMAGDLEAADRQMRWALELAEEVGEQDQVAQLAGTLARVSLRSGNEQEASSLSRLGRERSPAESVIAQAGWRAATGLLLARQGRSTEAERLGRESVAWIPRSMPDLRAEHLCDLAEILVLNGDEAGSERARAEAATLYREKGNTVGAAAAAAGTA